MRGLLIPVKDLRCAKQRLASLWTQEERTELAEAMLMDFLGTISRAHSLERIFLASSYDPALGCAREYGWEAIHEKNQISESESVDAASRICEAAGVTSLLRLPIDLPLLQPQDVDWLLSHATGAPSMVIVPSRDGAGTNALMRTPPTLFPSHFGPNSFAAHLAEARNCNARYTILEHPRLQLDIDDPADVEAFLSQPRDDCATLRWLEKKTAGNVLHVS